MLRWRVVALQLVGVEDHHGEPQALGGLDVGQLGPKLQAIVDDQLSTMEKFIKVPFVGQS